MQLAFKRWLTVTGALLAAIVLWSAPAHAQSGMVKGKVLDAKSQPVEAARLAGAGILRRTLLIDVPSMRGPLAAAALIAYVLSLTELAASLLTLRPGWQSVQVRIFNMVHYQSISEVAALCVIVILAALVPVVLARLLLSRKPA